MKTKILILLSVLCLNIVDSQAQIAVALKPLKQFRKDTLAFLNDNFAPEVRLYEEGRNLKIFMKEINQELPIKTFRILPNKYSDGFAVIDFYYYDTQVIKAKAKKNIKVPSIQFYFQTVTPREALYQEIQKTGIDLTGKLTPWDNKYLEVLNKLKLDYFIPNEYYEL